MDPNQNTNNGRGKVRSAATALIIEGGIILVLIVGILIALSYFGILPLPPVDSLLPNSSRQNAQSSTTQSSETNDLNRNTRPDIVAISENPGYTLRTNDKSALIHLLERWALYGKTYSYEAGGSTNGPLRTIETKLVPSPVNTSATTTESIPSSYDMQFSENSLIVSVYIDPEILEGDEASSYYSDILLRALFGMAHPTSNINEKVLLDNQYLSDRNDILGNKNAITIEKL